jgi:Flp pilus assembly protein TadD
MLKRAFKPFCFTRQFASVAGSAILALGLCGCQTTAPSDITGSLGDTADKSQVAVPRRDLDLYRERFRANPDDADAALQYGKALRATGQRSQAVAVLEQASIAHPGNKALLAGYGRALADNGNFQQAFDVLSQAHSPDDPDWRILSAQGAALDQLGRYDEARQYYASALRIAPDEPTVLSNLGLSYVLSKDLPKAEEVLRRAYDHADSDPRVRANLAVVVGLQGRMTEAETLMKAGLPPEQAQANVAELKRLLSRTAHAQRGAEKLPVASRATPD